MIQFFAGRVLPYTDPYFDKGKRNPNEFYSNCTAGCDRWVYDLLGAAHRQNQRYVREVALIPFNDLCWHPDLPIL